MQYRWIVVILFVLLCVPILVSASANTSSSTFSLYIDDLSDSQDVYVEDIFYVYASYSNTTDPENQRFNSLNVTCSVIFNNNGTSYTMVFQNASAGLDAGFYRTTMPLVTLRNFTVLCAPVGLSGTVSISLSDNITIYNSRIASNETKDNTLGSLFTTDQDIKFLANYTTSLNVTLSAGACNISFGDGSLDNSMDYNSSSKFFEYTRDFSSYGSTNYTVNCSDLSYGSRGLFVNLSIIQNRPFFTEIFTGSNSSLQSRYNSKIALIDLDEDDSEINLIQCGSWTSPRQIKVYSLDASSATLSVTYGNFNMTGCSFTVADYYKNNQSAIYATGSTGTSSVGLLANITSTSITGSNVSTLALKEESFTNYFSSETESIFFGFGMNRTTELTRVATGSLSKFANLTLLRLGFISILKELRGKFLLLSGITAVSDDLLRKSEVYIYNSSSSFSLSSSILASGFSSGACGRIFNNQTTYCAVSGVSSTDTITTLYAVLANGSLSTITTLVGVSKGTTKLIDVNNDGYLDLLLLGTPGDLTDRIVVYINDGVTGFNSNLTTFIPPPLGTNFYSSLDAMDIDLDGDVDVSLSGVIGGSIGYTGIWFNNMSLWNPNYAPDKMSDPDVDYDGGMLQISWSAPDDDNTPDAGLTYNLNVGTTPGGSDIISGKLGASTSDTMLAMGNMQYLRATNLTLPVRTYYVRVQALDTSLRKGAWSDVVAYSPLSCQVSGVGLFVSDTCSIISSVRLPADTNIVLSNSSASLTVEGTSILFNASTNLSSGIQTNNGTLVLEDVTITNSNSSNWFFVNLTTTATLDDVQITNATMYVTNSSAILRNVNITGILIVNATNVSVENVTAISIIFSKNGTVTNVSFNSVQTDSNVVVVRRQFLHINTSPSSVLTRINSSVYDSSQTITSQVFLLNISNFTSGSEVNYSVYTLNFSKRRYFDYVTTVNVSAQTKFGVALNTTSEPYWDEFENSLSTNLTTLALNGQIGSVNNLTLSIANLGSVTFKSLLNLSGLNLSAIVRMSNNSIYVNGTSINTSANLTFYNRTFVYEPVVLEDGQVCTSCDNESYNNVTGVFTVDVEHFTNYSLTNNTQLSVSEETDYFKFVAGRNVTFVINYSMTTGGAATVANCNIYLGNGTSYSANYDGNRQTYNVSISFAVNQSYEYDAVCLKNGFETQNISSRITVSSDAPEFSDSGISLSGVTYSSMIYYNDTVYVWGLNSSGDDIVYKFNGTDVSTVDSNINPFSKGAAVAADFRHTGELDFIIPDEGIAPSLFWIKNVTGTVTRSNLTGTRTINTGSMALIDVNNDDYMDVFVTPGFTSNTSMLLINNRGLGFNLTNVSYGLIYSQVLVMDINQDNYSDVLITGENSSQVAKSYVLTNIQNNTFTQGVSFLQNVSQGHLISLNSTRILSSGIANRSYIASLDVGNFSAILLSNSGIAIQTLSPFANGYLFFSDINSDGYRDLIYAGSQNFANTLLLGRSYLFNYTSSSFVINESIYLPPKFYGSSIVFDYLNDGDLDALISGSNGVVANTSTQFYTSDQSEYLANTAPTAPYSSYSIVNNNDGFSGGIGRTANISLNWSGASDDLTPVSLLSYNVRIGTLTNRNKYVSGIASSSSNPVVQFSGNMLEMTVKTYSGIAATQCTIYGIQAFDAGYAASDWNETTIAYSETCDGLDNDCDGLADENWDVLNDGFVNETSSACAAYLAVYPSRSDGCDTKADTNTANSVKDCPSQSSRPSGGGGGGGGTPPITEEDVANIVDEQARVDTPTTTTDPPAPEPDAPPADRESDKASTDITVEHRGGRTYVTEIVRNTQRTTVSELIVRKVFPKSILLNATRLISITPYVIIEEDPILEFNLGTMSYLQSKPLVYSIPGTFSTSEIESQVVSVFLTKQTISEAAVLEETIIDTITANASITSNVTEEVDGNQTKITINLDLLENVTSVQGVEIEQYIPKCLISEITQAMLDAGVDKSLLNSVTIKESDPIIVWNLKEVNAKTQLTLKLNTLRDSDCLDEIKIKTLAKEYIRANYEINPLNLTKSVMLSVFLFMLFVVLFIFSVKLKGHHENPNVHRLTKIILHSFHKGQSFDHIESSLLANKEQPAHVSEALSHVRNKKLHERHIFWRVAIEHSIEIFIFFVALVLNAIEFIGLLPGYLDWVKIILSWVLILILFYQVDMCKLVVNNTRKWINITLITGMFLIHLKTLVAYAKSLSLESNTFFIFDLYAYVLNHAEFFNVTLFYIGCALLLIASITMAWKLPILEGSLYFTFTHHPIAHTLVQKIKRSLKLFSIYLFFGFAVFNRVVEWLAVAIDSTVFVLTLLLLLIVLASTTFVHHHKPLRKHIVGLFVEGMISNSVALLLFFVFLFAFIQPFLPTIWVQGIIGLVVAGILFVVLYTIVTGIREHFTGLEHITLIIDNVTLKFIKLFSHPSTIFLGLSGLFLLQNIAELVIYIIPNITGEGNSAYSQLSAETLLGIFSEHSIISAHLFTLGLMDKIVYGLIYAISLLGGALLFIVPIVLWALYFIHRGNHPSQVSITELFFVSAGSFKRICKYILVIAVPSIIVFAVSGVLKITFVTGLTENTDLGVVISAHKLILMSDYLILILCAYILYIIVASLLLWGSSKNPITKSHLVSITLVVSLSSLLWIYVVPYVQSVILYLGLLINLISSATLQNKLLLGILSSLFVADLIIIYGCGIAILVFFALPRAVKNWIIRAMSHIPFFHRLFFLSSSLSHIDYYVHASEQLSGNIVHHVAHYIFSTQKEGHHLETVIYQLKIHGYPQEIISAALSQLIADKKFIHTVETSHAEHLSVEKVKHLIPIVKREIKTGASQTEVHEEFMDDYTFAEIKLALLHATGDLKGEISIEKIDADEDKLIVETLDKVRKKIANKESRNTVTEELIKEGIDPELVIKILDHPLLNKDEATNTIKEIQDKLILIISSPNSEDEFVKLLAQKYPYQLLSKALDCDVCKKEKVGRAVTKTILWAIGNADKGFTREKMAEALQSHSWREDVISELVNYAYYVKENIHRVDKIIEHNYIKIEK